MKVGNTVYVINAKTNKIDEWIFDGVMLMPNGLFYRLTRGREFCALPRSCVFETKDQALANVKFF